MIVRKLRKYLSESLLPRVFGVAINLVGLLSPKTAGAWALRVFTKVRGGRLHPGQRLKVQSAEFERLDAAGHAIQVYRWPGEGPRVLLVHGWQSNSARWRHLIPLLEAEGFDVFAFDAPGHGGSGGSHLHVPLYPQVIRHLRDRYAPSFLVGHSVGGMAILYDLYQHPGHSVEKIVAIGSPARFSIIMDEYQRLLGLGRHVRQAIDAYVLAWLGISVFDFHSMAFTRELEVPGLLLHDLEDDKISYQASVRVSESWRSSQILLTRGYGHSMHVPEVNQCVVDYLCERPLSLPGEVLPDALDRGVDSPLP